MADCYLARSPQSHFREPSRPGITKGHSGPSNVRLKLTDVTINRRAVRYYRRPFSVSRIYRRGRRVRRTNLLPRAHDQAMRDWVRDETHFTARISMIGRPRPQESCTRKLHSENTTSPTYRKDFRWEECLWELMGGPSIGTFLNFVVWQHQTSYRPEILTAY